MPPAANPAAAALAKPLASLLPKSPALPPTAPKTPYAPKAPPGPRTYQVATVMTTGRIHCDQALKPCGSVYDSGLLKT
jgi:hypothetical protein